jgi:hypothetical protein
MASRGYQLAKLPVRNYNFQNMSSQPCDDERHGQWPCTRFRISMELFGEERICSTRREQHSGWI